MRRAAVMPGSRAATPLTDSGNGGRAAVRARQRDGVLGVAVEKSWVCAAESEHRLLVVAGDDGELRPGSQDGDEPRGLRVQVLSVVDEQHPDAAMLGGRQLRFGGECFKRDADELGSAESAGMVACGAAIPAAARSSITCSYCWANRPAATHSGCPLSRPIRSSCGPSTPRSLQRDMRSRSPVANPTVVNAGRNDSGHITTAFGPSAEIAGEEFSNDPVLLGARDQPWRRTAVALRRQSQHRERVRVHGAHKRLAARPATGPARATPR